MTEVLTTLIKFVVVIVPWITHCRSLCTFPEYLWRRLPDGSDRIWLTEYKFINRTASVKDVLENTVELSVITTKVYDEQKCDGAPNCYYRVVVDEVECVEQVTNDSFRVRHVKFRKERPMTCMKFIRRNSNVVQVWEGGSGDGPDICDHNNLRRNDWPWIIQEQEEWVACPLVGGYDFKITTNRDEPLCPREWLPSRMESECIEGEGLLLTFPSPRCSPFHDSRLDQRLQCWAHWQEDVFRFVLAGVDNKTPQFVFRFPNTVSDTLTVEWYFSPQALLTSSSRQSHFGHVRLTMKQSESGTCYDASEACEKKARDGDCSRSGTVILEDAHHCKKSCGLCNLGPSPAAECVFPKDMQGRWLLYESNRRDEVMIIGGLIYITSLGNFTCKAIQWNRTQFKLIAVYRNGCRPRYSCIQLQRRGNIMEFQISRSAANDESFELCKFELDPPPLSGLIHSPQPKILLPYADARFGTCGLDSELPVFVGPRQNYMGRKGMLSNWNRQICGSSSRMRLCLIEPCNPVDIITYTCSAYIQGSRGVWFLLTHHENNHSNAYQCWVILTAYGGKSSVWRTIYRLNRAQCGAEDDYIISSLRHEADLVLETSDGERGLFPCDQSNLFITSHPSTKPTGKGNRHGPDRYMDPTSRASTCYDISIDNIVIVVLFWMLA